MSVIYPVIAMAFLTFLLGFPLLFTRVSSVQNGTVTIDFYKIFKGGEPPESVIMTTRHWSNLYEAPTLFYVVCALILIMNIENSLLVWLAWAYVAIRVLHSTIHLTYNAVYHRLAMFLLSQTVLIVMWVVLLLEII